MAPFNLAEVTRWRRGILLFFLQVPCPVCRCPFRTPVKDLPANFVVQNVIAESLHFQPGKGLCQACCRSRKLELATSRCQDCDETLCESCSTEHADQKHDLKSLEEKTCDKHHQKLALYCIGCRTNVCVRCFSESHHGHEYSEIDKMAEELTETLNYDVEQLRSCGPRLEAVLEAATSQKKKYERHLSEMEDHVSCRSTRQRLRAAEEAFQLEKTPRNVDNFMKTKLKAINAIIERDNSDKAIDHGQVRSLIRDVDVLLGVEILKLSSHTGRLQKVLSDIQKLQTKASDILCNGSTSTYDVTDNAITIIRLDEEIKTLLQRCTDEECASSGKEEISVMYTSSDNEYIGYFSV